MTGLMRADSETQNYYWLKPSLPTPNQHWNEIKDLLKKLIEAVEKLSGGEAPDARYLYLKAELGQFDNCQLNRILDNEHLCCDTYNFDENTGFYCPVAVALGIPDDPSIERTDRSVKARIRELGYSLKSTTKLPGVFYTSDREADIRNLVTEILWERSNVVAK
jgi:hypothetical protein